MTKKQIFLIGSQLVLVIVLLTSVVSAQFMRIDGEDGYGYGYGYGYEVGFGWDEGNPRFGNGFRLPTEDLDPDEWGYGYGYSYKNSTNFSRNEEGTYQGSIDDVDRLVQEGVMTPLDLAVVGEGFSIGGLTFEADTVLDIGNSTLVSIPSGTSFTFDETRAIVGDGEIGLGGTTAVSTSGLPSGYAAVADGAVQFGLPDMGVTLSQPITIIISVSSSYNGQTLKVLRKTVGGEWGLLTTCLVADSMCQFTTDHLSSFTTATYTTPAAIEISSSGGGGGPTVPFTPKIASSTTPTKFVVKNNCYKLEKGKVQLMAKSNCYLRVYNKKTKKYTEVLKAGITPALQLVRIGKGNAIYSIEGKCKNKLNISNWKTLVSANRVTSITAKKMASYPNCLIVK